MALAAVLVLVTLAIAQQLEETFYIPLDDPAIQYGQRPADDPVARLQQRMERGEAKLELASNGFGYLPSILKQLGINPDSQALVFSKTSTQAENIGPRTPRAIYFNDDVMVGFVRDSDVLEFASLDPKQGIQFYVLVKAAEPAFAESQGCLRCHQGAPTLGIPGLLISSVHPVSQSRSEHGNAFMTDHRTPLSGRWQLSGRLLGERDGQDPLRGERAGGHLIGDPVRDGGGLAGAGAGEDDDGAPDLYGGRSLGVVQPREDLFGCAHLPTLPVRTDTSGRRARPAGQRNRSPARYFNRAVPCVPGNVELMSEHASTLGELRAAGYPDRTVKQELRDNLLEKLQAGEAVFPGVVGFEGSVLPALERGLLAGHDLILLGERGQAKTRLVREIVNLLDDVIPVIAGCEIHDHPYRPICARCRALVETEGDAVPVAWLPREDRYAEKLATPDTSVGDLIGDVDPIKVAEGRYLGDELTIHYGMIPRTHRGIVAINELPDLPERIQVSLFNILEERDIQIRGYRIRLPLDLLMVATANPDDYTHRGRIVSPLKDRFGTQVRTHYPETLAEEIRIMDQEARPAAGSVPVRIPAFMKEVVAALTSELRRSPHVNHRSGVSVATPSGTSRRSPPRPSAAPRASASPRPSPGSATCPPCWRRPRAAWSSTPSRRAARTRSSRAPCAPPSSRCSAAGSRASTSDRCWSGSGTISRS